MLCNVKNPLCNAFVAGKFLVDNPATGKIQTSGLLIDNQTPHNNYIYEIIYNLCDNAIRYNVEAGKVTITISKEAGRVAVIVADTGIGIAPEHHSRIFERFYRVDKSHSKATGGTGLGLSIVKHAVQYHSGKVTLDSELGKGTTIKIVF